MNLSHEANKLLIVGASGTGKSTYWTKYVLNSYHVKKFVFDHEGEFAFRHGMQPVYELTDEIVARNQFIIYDPSEQFEGDVATAFDYFCDLCFRVCKTISGPKLFCADEMQKLVDTYNITPELSSLMETGRRYEIDTAFVGQQANLLHGRLRNQLTECVTFRQIDERAIKFLADVGFDETAIRALENLNFIARNLRTGTQISGKIEFDRSLPSIVALDTPATSVGTEADGGDGDSENLKKCQNVDSVPSSSS